VQKLAGEVALPLSHSHRGFSPVTRQLLPKGSEPFQRFFFIVHYKFWKPLKTVKRTREASFHHRAEATV
jgi:hypothetical protein